jgi:hypothetical protein
MPRNGVCLDGGRSGQARHLPAKIGGRSERTRAREASQRRVGRVRKLTPPERSHPTPAGGVGANEPAADTRIPLGREGHRDAVDATLAAATAGERQPSITTRLADPARLNTSRSFFDARESPRPCTCRLSSP